MTKSLKKGQPKPEVEPGRFKVPYLLIAAMVLVLLINVIFYATYPINIGQSDNITFVRMIAQGTSNLFHASGYSSVMRIFMVVLHPIQGLDVGVYSPESGAWYRGLQQLQLVMHLVLFLAVIFLFAKLFGTHAATLLSIGWGFNLLFMSAVNAVTPEWFQGDILLLCLLLVAYARKLRRTGKIVVYSSASLIFALSYLVKYNSLLFAAPLLVLLAFDEETWLFKVAQAAASALLVFAVVHAYVVFVHSKSTGSRQLTFDHAWVLTASMPADYLLQPPESLGINTLRWHALVTVSPPEYGRAGPVWNIDYGPDAEMRQKCNELYDKVFRSSREELVSYVNSHPLPKTYFHFSAATPLYYYYGLERIDRLGIEVYKESLRHQWKVYLYRVLNLARWAVFMPDNHPVPTLAHPLDLKLASPDANGEMFYKMTPGTVPVFMTYYSPSEVLTSYTGFRITGWLDAVTSSTLPYALMNIMALLGILRLRKVDMLYVLCMLGGLAMFMGASAMLMGMRTKEQITVTPLYFALVAAGLVSAFRWGRELWKAGRVD
jgi:hypothetical protein